MKNSWTVQLHITAHDEDVTEQKKINYPTILNAIFYCQMENSSMERKCQEGCSHNSGPREHRVWFESYFLLSLPWQRIVAIDPRTKISFRLWGREIMVLFQLLVLFESHNCQYLSMMSSLRDVVTHFFPNRHSLTEMIVLITM